MPVQENTQPQAETKQSNKERLKEITDSIEKGIKELFESDKYKQYLMTIRCPFPPQPNILLPVRQLTALLPPFQRGEGLQGHTDYAGYIPALMPERVLLLVRREYYGRSLQIVAHFPSGACRSFS